MSEEELQEIRQDAAENLEREITNLLDNLRERNEYLRLARINIYLAELLGGRTTWPNA